MILIDDFLKAQGHGHSANALCISQSLPLQYSTMQGVKITLVN